jgi:hypothetical protein
MGILVPNAIASGIGADAEFYRNAAAGSTE